MTKKDLQTVRDALKILENEFQETTNELKTYIFVGQQKQAMAFFDSANKYDVDVSLTESDVTTLNTFRTYIVKTEPVNEKDYDWLDKLAERINKTVKYL